MIRQCVTCGDPADDGKRCRFCETFQVSRSAAPNSVVRRRVMRELDDANARAETWIIIADSSMREARWWRRCAGALAVAMLAALVFAVMMLNALPSASAATVSAEPPKSRLDRELARVCPSFRVMPRRHCLGWLRVAQCETGGQQWSVTVRSMRQIRWRYNGRSGFDGGLQFSPRTWRGNIGRVPARRLTRAQWIARERGRYRYAWAAPSAVQILAADALRVRPGANGLGNWPACGGWW